MEVIYLLLKEEFFLKFNNEYIIDEDYKYV